MRRTRFLARVSAFVVPLLVLTGPSPAGAGAGRMGSASGAFNADCSFSHRLHDDPIVFPGQHGASHSHDFLGSTVTDADTTPSQLQGASTLCDRYGSRDHKDADRSAYWAPTLYVSNKPVTPGTIGVYYFTGYRASAGIKPFPAGLRMITGNAMAAGPPEAGSDQTYSWSCDETVRPGTATTAPTCNSQLVLTITFPDCWNGRTLDSRDHKSHMARSQTDPASGTQQRYCPPSHPVLLPQLRLTIPYPSSGGPTTRLASGPIYTAHADFMNGWDQKEITRLVCVCLVADKYCGGTDSPVPGHP